MNKVILRRFKELEDEMNAVEDTKYTEIKTRSSIKAAFHGTDEKETYEYVDFDNQSFLKWYIKIKSFMVDIKGKNSEYYQKLMEIEKEDISDLSLFNSTKIIFIALKEDYEKGYLSSIETLVQAEVFESQLEQAEELLKNGYILASAVIAGVVLETAIRELCTQENITHDTLNKMNADLTKAGVYNKLQQKRITALADIRNSAAHGKPEKFTKEDVKMMIRDIEQFLATQLSE